MAFDARYPGATFPGHKAVAVTPSDSATFETTRGVYVGTAGDLVVRFAGDTANVTLKNVVAGVTHPWSIVRVAATGTTATDIVVIR